MLTCNVVKDLLPSYVDQLVSQETAAEIAEHLADCPACNEEYEKMMTPLVPIAAQDEKDIDYLKKIKKVNNRKTLRYSVASVIAVTMIFVLGVQVFYIGSPVKSEDMSYTIYKPNENSIRIEMELENGYQMIVKTNNKYAYNHGSGDAEEVILIPRQVRNMPFDDVGNRFSWGYEVVNGSIPGDFRVIIRFADQDVILTVEDFQQAAL